MSRPSGLATSGTGTGTLYGAAPRSIAPGDGASGLIQMSGYEPSQWHKEPALCGQFHGVRIGLVLAIRSFTMKLARVVHPLVAGFLVIAAVGCGGSTFSAPAKAPTKVAAVATPPEAAAHPTEAVEAKAPPGAVEAAAQVGRAALEARAASEARAWPAPKARAEVPVPAEASCTSTRGRMHRREDDVPYDRSRWHRLLRGHPVHHELGLGQVDERQSHVAVRWLRDHLCGLSADRLWRSCLHRAAAPQARRREPCLGRHVFRAQQMRCGSLVPGEAMRAAGHYIATMCANKSTSDAGIAGFCMAAPRRLVSTSSSTTRA